MATPENRSRAASPDGLRAQTPEIIARRQTRGPELLFTKARSSWPFLFDWQEQQSNGTSGLRFNLVNGFIAIPQWIDSTKAKSKDQIILRRRKKGEGYIEQRILPYKTIEGAMRATSTHIPTKYRPGEERTSQIKTLTDYIDELMRRIDNGEITKYNLKSEFNRGLEKIENSGFLKAQKNLKKGARDQIIAALSPDSIGRSPNRLIARTRLASAWLKAMQLMSESQYVTRKYDRIFFDLYAERSIERLKIENVMRESDFAQSLIAQNRSPLESLERLRNVTFHHFRSNSIRVAPYRVPTMLFSALLFGPTFPFPELNEDKAREMIDKCIATQFPDIDDQTQREVALQLEMPIDNLLRIHGGSDEVISRINERLIFASTLVNEAMIKYEDWTIHV